MKVLKRKEIVFAEKFLILITRFDFGGYDLSLTSLSIPITSSLQDAPCSGAKLRLKARLPIA